MAVETRLILYLEQFLDAKFEIFIHLKILRFKSNRTFQIAGIPNFLKLQILINSYTFYILEKHPEIKKLMVLDHSFKYVVTLLVLFQFAVIGIMSHFDLSWTVVFVLTYTLSGTINHAILLSLHEISHNMAFGHAKPMYNKLFSIFVNFPIGVPMALSFRKYHAEHHKYLGHEFKDPDSPTEFEAKLFTNSFRKTIWIILQPFFYALRPLVVHPIVASQLEVFNFALQAFVDSLVVYYLGPKALFYMIAGSLLGMGLHPVAGHFLSEHYMFSLGFDGTYSYYGILNKVTFNVGYHNEHHDFPNIPGKLLPKVREFAPEYYNTIPYHTSWLKVIYDYITDPAIGPYARIKRKDYLYRTKNNTAAEEISNGASNRKKID